MVTNAFERLKSIAEDLKDWFQRRWTHILIPLVIAVVCGLLVQNPFVKDFPTYRPGEIAQSDIKAPSPMLVVDEELTKKKQLEAEQKVRSVFDFDSDQQQSASSRIKISFEIGRSKPDAIQQSEFEEQLQASLPENIWQSLQGFRFDRKIQQSLEFFVASFFQYWILEKPIDDSRKSSEVIIRDLFSEKESLVPWELFKEKTILLSDVHQRLSSDKALRTQATKIGGTERMKLASVLAKNLISTNLSFNQIETSARKEEARTVVEPVVVEIAKGEMIIREGERFERKDVLLLEGLRNAQQNKADIKSYVGFSALIFALIFVFHWIGVKNFSRFRLSNKDRLVLGGFFVTSVAVVTGLNGLFDAAQAQSTAGLSIKMLIPFAFVGMTLRLISSIEITFFFTLLFSVCVSWLLKEPYIGLIALTVSLTGAAGMRHISQRLDVLKAGAIAGLMQSAAFCLGVIMGLTEPTGLANPWMNLAATAGLSFSAGIFSAGIVLFTQPLIEFVGYTTDLRLMELSNTNHPLLRELIMKAPGSYFHSFAVSQLSEKAAEAINANPLFARVAALYHDVGKVKKPQYFIENIKGENKHDKIVPSMSALIISNHVKEGIELAHDHNLPQSIVDCIPQHHGTALISYFYEKAKEAAKETGEEIDDRDFRYPGPKPQTKEAAIIMLADAVEATAKSAPQSGIDQLRQKVNMTIRRFFLDGQLDECDLSLKDLNAIGNAFVNVLQGIYHQRIEYPHLKTNPGVKADPEDSLLKRDGS